MAGRERRCCWNCGNKIDSGMGWFVFRPNPKLLGIGNALIVNLGKLLLGGSVIRIWVVRYFRMLTQFINLVNTQVFGELVLMYIGHAISSFTNTG